MIQFRSEREISEMRKAGLLIWQAHQIAAEMIRPGVTTLEIDARVEEFFTEHAVVPLFKNYPNSLKGKRAFPAVTCMSINEEVVHGIASSRQLREGDIVSIDTGCKLAGWCADAAVTHPVGEVSAEVRKLLDCTRRVLRLSIDLMGKKQFWSEIAVEMAAFVAKAGFSTVEEFVGHGVGRDMHEDPQVPNYVSPQLKKRGGNFPLRPGLVIAVEPMVNVGTKRVKLMADDWTMATKDGKPSAHFEHTIAMTNSGPRVLTAPPLPDEPEWVHWGKDRLKPPDAWANHVAW
ncbi:MAG: type I methionyl aminopeptidase [Pirellulales bacterium]